MRLWRRRPTKEDAELGYWREVLAREGTFANGQYEGFFTTQFGLTREDYVGKRVLDIGCGPRGSLEWATMASVRVGADPLVDRYRELGIDAHAMEYVHAGAESLPFEDAAFDVISSFNSLDHVDEVGAAIREMTRVAAPGALGLLFVEIGHEPTAMEPQTLDWDLLDRFTGWSVRSADRFGLDDEHHVYRSWLLRRPWSVGPGLLSALLERD